MGNLRTGTEIVNPCILPEKNCFHFGMLKNMLAMNYQMCCKSKKKKMLHLLKFAILLRQTHYYYLIKKGLTIQYD